MSSHIENKAIQLRDQAVKKMNSNGFFQALFGSGNKTDEAIEYYTRAGNLFKVAKNWLQAGLAFIDAADLDCKVENYFEAALNYTEAANCFRKCDVSKAIEYYFKATKFYMEIGRWLTAAKLHQTIAELLENERDMNGASDHYERAAELFKEENHHSLANRSLQKVAELAAIERKYQKAIKIFQDIACFDLSSSLLKATAKEYFFRAAICHLCNDVDIVQSVLYKYAEMYPAFKDCRECHLILCLLECIETRDLEGYANAIRTFDATSKLSMWHVTMLLRAKHFIENEPDLK